jgi:hypothetical protein
MAPRGSNVTFSGGGIPILILMIQTARQYLLLEMPAQITMQK